MKSSRQFAVRVRCLVALVAVGCFVPQAAAATRVFTLVPASSSLKITGTIASLATLSAQTSGSDTATFSGTISSSIDSTGIQFPGGSSIAANTFSGATLIPDAIADYGLNAKFLGSTVAQATVVNLKFDATSGDLAVASNGTFPVNSVLTATALAGAFDYNSTLDGNGTDVVAGDSATNQSTATASLVLVGQTQTLTVPVKATITFTVSNPNDSSATFTGQFVATTTLVTPTTAYWTGNVDASWNTINQAATATNWATDATGATDTQDYPGATTDVFFNASAANGSHLSTTLAANFSIKGLTFSSAATSSVTIGGASTLTLGTDGIAVQSGAAAPTINSPLTLGGSQNWTINGANPLTVNGALSTAGFTLTKMGTGTLTVGGVPNLATNSALNVSAGTLILQPTAAPTIGSGVTATVAAGATLQLAGSVSALSNGAARVNITNSSTAAGTGVIVSGTNQQVGAIDGAGNLTVNAGGTLTANHVRQKRPHPWRLGRPAGNVDDCRLECRGRVAGDRRDRRRIRSSRRLAGTGSFGSGLDTAADLLAGDSAVSTAGGDLATGGSLPNAGQAVPEPSTLLLTILGGLACLAAMLRRRRGL